jgi:hypothetical protein
MAAGVRALAAIPFISLKPFDRHGLADRVMTRCPAAHLARLHRVDHAVTQVLRIHLLLASAKANRLNQNLADSGILLRFDPSAGALG